MVIKSFNSSYTSCSSSIGFLLYFISLKLLFCCISGNLYPQNPDKYITHSEYVYIYRLSKAETDKIYSKKKFRFSEEYFKNKTDSFPFNSDPPKLPAGNYIFVKADQMSVYNDVITSSNLTTKLVNNNRDFAVRIFDISKQSEIKEARVKLNNREILYDTISASYRLRNYRKKGTLRIETNDELIYVKIEKFFNGKRKPLVDEYPSYIAFNKPKYLPGDTVKLKAFITRKGEPLNKKINFRIMKWNRELFPPRPVKPVSPGSYLYEFPVTDSLEIDARYEVEFVKKIKKRSWQERILASGSLYIEDYLLDEVVYNVQSENDNYLAGEPIVLYMAAADFNGLPVYDAKASIKIVPVSIGSFDDPSTALPFIVFTLDTALDAGGETKIIIPGSVFPGADILYEAIVTFTNSNNELQKNSCQFNVNGCDRSFVFEKSGDTVIVNYFEKGKKTEADGHRWVYKEGDVLGKLNISFPYKFIPDPLAENYLFACKGLEKVYQSPYPKISFTGYRSKDSIVASITNPASLDVYFELSKEGKIIQRGISKQINYRAKDESSADYALLIHYFMRSNFTEIFNILPQENSLKVELIQPEKVFPGEKSQVTVSVKDFQDKPVSYADITASSVNAQFPEKNIPVLPDFNKKVNLRKRQYHLYESKAMVRSEQEKVSSFWRERLGLNKIHFYNLVDPGSELYKFYDSIHTGNAQFSPYITDKGKFVHIYMIYVDDTLVEADMNEYSSKGPYSIVSSPGMHTIRLRTIMHEFVLDNIEFKLNQKLGFSFDINNLPAEIKKIRMGRNLSSAEKKMINENALLIRNISERYSDEYFFWQREDFVRQAGSKDYVILRRGENFNYKIRAGYNDVSMSGNFIFSPPQAFLMDKTGVELVKPETGHQRLKKFPYEYYEIGETALTLKDIQKNNKGIPGYRYYSDVNHTQSGNGSFVFNIESDSLIENVYLSNKYSSYVEFNRSYDRGELINNILPGIYKAVCFTGNRSFFIDDSVVVEADKIVLKNYNRPDFLPWDSLPDDPVFRNFDFYEARRDEKRPGSENSYSRVQLKLDAQFQGRRKKMPGFFNVVESPEFYIDNESIFNKYYRRRARFFRYRRNVKRKFRPASVRFLGGESDKYYKGNTRFNEENAEQIYKLSILRETYDKDYKLLSGKLADSTISSEPGISKIRSDFTDYAYWQPVLYTDENGNATFEAKFPDNMTRWNSYAAAMTGNRQSGIAYAETKVFKPVIASLSLPRFMVEGDTAMILGKSLNYTSQKLKINTFFKKNGETIYFNTDSLEKSLIEKAKIAASSEDTVNIEYSLEAETNYRDGESKKIPVFPAGIEEVKGEFYYLEKDTSFIVSIDTSQQYYEISALDNDFDVLLERIEKVKSYRYECNEQLASKLTVLLMERNINKHLGKISFQVVEIKRIINKLEKAQKADGSWGWWKDSPTDYFMTIYVTDILSKALKTGYWSSAVNSGLNFISSHLRGMENNNLVYAMNVLAENKIIFDKSYIANLQEQHPELYTKYTLLKIKQELDMPYDIEELLTGRKETILGGYYWGDENYSWFNSSTRLSLLAYKILEKEGKNEAILSGIRRYFLEYNYANANRNTFEAASIIETILPGILRESKSMAETKTTLIITDVNEQSVQKFPYVSKPAITSDKIRITKKGGPVYLSVFYRTWNKNPHPKDEIFAVSTSCLADGKKIEKLKVGKITSMRVDITAKKKSDYVMIEIPIPAGCTYDNKVQSFNNYEIHREYFKDRVAIFCGQLPVGNYTYEFSLQPRYQGNYCLNPSNVELMYFPVFNGRNGMKKIDITE